MNQYKLVFVIGYRGGCLSGVRRVTGSSSLYNHMERILFPVLPHFITKKKTTKEKEDNIWNV